MKGWILNASPVILLAKIGAIELIESLNPEFRIPETVVREIGEGPDGDPAIRWMNSESTRQHWVDTPEPPSHLVQWDLGAGETSVLSLAISDPNSPVVLDDRAARRFELSSREPCWSTPDLLQKNITVILISLQKNRPMVSR